MKISKILIALLLVVSFTALSPSNARAAADYSDVPVSSEYYNAVQKLIELGAISTETEKFNPSNNVTRGQAAKILAITLGLDTTNVTDPQFNDVPKSNTFYPYVAALANEKIISGYSNGNFGVNDPLRRGQMAKILVKGFELSEIKATTNTYADVDASTETGMYIETLAHYDIASKSNTYFNPNSYIKRSQLALFIERMLGIVTNESEDIIIYPSEFGIAAFKEIYAQEYYGVVEAEYSDQELTLHPIDEGIATFNIYDENMEFVKFLLVEVEEINGSLKVVDYKIVSDITSEHKISSTVTFEEMSDGSQIKSYIIKNLTKNEVVIADTLSEDEFVYVGNHDFDYYLLTLENKEGATEQYIFTSEEHEYMFDTLVFIVDPENKLTLPTAKWESNLPQTVDGEGQVVITYSKPGTYSVNGHSEEKIVEYELQVIEVDGILAYTFMEITNLANQ